MKHKTAFILCTDLATVGAARLALAELNYDILSADNLPEAAAVLRQFPYVELVVIGADAFSKDKLSAQTFKQRYVEPSIRIVTFGFREMLTWANVQTESSRLNREDFLSLIGY